MTLRCPRWLLFLVLAALAGAAGAEAPSGFEGRWRVLEDSQKAVEKALRGARRELRRGRGQAVLRDLRVPEATLASPWKRAPATFASMVAPDHRCTPTAAPR